MGDLLGDISRWIVETVYSFGYAGVFVLVALAGLHLPVPMEITLPLSGYLVEQGRFSFVPTLLAATSASVTSALILYALGRRMGEARLRRFVRRFGRFALVGEADLDRVRALFERHGPKAILAGRLTPGVGNLISIAAGLYCMPVMGWFMVLTVLDSALYNAALIGLGWFLGANWTLVEHYTRYGEYAGLLVVAALITWLFWRRSRSRKKIP